MKARVGVLTWLVLVGGVAHGQEGVPAQPADEEPEILTRGPVHEAYAVPVPLQAQAGIVAPYAPPDNIAEATPEEGPAGGNYVWVPGYWAWDSDRETYVWVTGCWRAAPPGMYWMPGYWAQVTKGREWIPGFWAPVDGGELEYLPAPPEVEQAGPGRAAPSPNHVWVPPCYFWRDGRYVWRPGYWLVQHAGWVWVPSYYVWTPRGYVFAAGHWDYDLDRRGVLFAPIDFPRPLIARAGFVFAPSIVIDTARLHFELFARPRYHHYYFGDYYDESYVRVGIYPWFEFERFATWYDPVFLHLRWRHRRSEPGWGDRIRAEYDRRRGDHQLRPPRTYREQEARRGAAPDRHRGEVRPPAASGGQHSVRSARPQTRRDDVRSPATSGARQVERRTAPRQSRRQLVVAEPLHVVSSRPDPKLKLERLTTDRLRASASRASQVYHLRDSRRRWEAQPRARAAIGSGRTAVRPNLGIQPKKQAPTAAPERQGNTQIRRRTSPVAAGPGPGFVPRRNGSPDQPERVRVPDSPIRDHRGLSKVFRKGPPSRPSDERKAAGQAVRTDRRRRGE